MARWPAEDHFFPAAFTTMVPLMVFPCTLQWYLNSPSFSNLGQPDKTAEAGKPDLREMGPPALRPGFFRPGPGAWICGTHLVTLPRGRREFLDRTGGRAVRGRAAGAGARAPRPWRSGELARWVAGGPWILGTYGVGRVRRRAGAAWRTRCRAWPARRPGTSPPPPRIPSENVPGP